MNQQKIKCFLFCLQLTIGTLQAQLYTDAWGPDYNNGVLYLGRSSNPDNILIVGDKLSSTMYFRTANTNHCRIDANGRLAIGNISPTKLLHLYGANPVMYVQASSGNPGIEYGSSGTVVSDITYTASTGQLKIGPTNSSYKSIFFRSSGTGNIIFSNNPSFATSGNTGLNGNYLFDAQVSACSLMVAPAEASGSYRSLPSGYLFNVQGGHSNFNGRVNINYSTSTTPDKNLAGLNICNTSTYYYIQTNKSKPLALNPDPHAGPSKDSSYVAIGFTPGTFGVPANYKLAVKGRIICEELKVKFAGLWSDYVFEKDYKLRELKEVEKYIEANKHLPDVPSEAEVKENGIETGQMDATLLRKIEELTLYMIQQDKKMEEMKGGMKRMEVKIKELESKK